MMSDDLLFYILNSSPDNVHYIKRYLSPSTLIATLIYYPDPENATKANALQMRRTVTTNQDLPNFPEILGRYFCTHS